MMMRPNVTAVVLAGGRGTRIASLYPDLPKPMIPAAGEPFLFWVTAWLARQGIGDIVYSTGYRADQVEAWAKRATVPPALTLRCQVEETALGTGGAIVNCRTLCSATVLAINGDTLLLADLAPAFDRFADERLDGMIVAKPVDDTSRYGSLDVADGMLRGFHEKRPGRGLVNGGTLILRRSLLDALPEGQPLSLEQEIMPRILAEGRRIGVIVADVPFLDIGTPETVRQADAFIGSNTATLSFG